MDLSTFLAELAKSPALRDEFAKTPHIVSDRFSLTKTDRDALRTGDQAAIDTALKAGLKQIWIVTPEWIIEPDGL